MNCKVTCKRIQTVKELTKKDMVIMDCSEREEGNFWDGGYLLMEFLKDQALD